jgi:hypothetical protein
MASYGGYGPDQSQIRSAMAAGTYFAPPGSPNPLGSGSNVSSGSSKKWAEAFELASKALASTFGGDRDRNSYRDQSAEFGSSVGSNTSEGPDKWSKIYTPVQQQPVYLPGVQGDPGIGGSLLGAAGSIGAALISDIRFKENIEKVGTSSSGTNVYRWNYIGSPQRYQGVIAQEVPWACVDKDGIKYVDYSKVDVDFQEVNV